VQLIVVAGPPSAGKTALIKQIIRHFHEKRRVAFLKIDVVKAFEDEELAAEFGILTAKVYSGDLCPDHAGVMVLGDTIAWASGNGADLLLVESAGLCLRCAPYLNQGLGIVVLSSISGIHAPLKMGAMVSLADVAVVTKIDLVSQAEREVFLQKIREAHPHVRVFETNALQGTALQRLFDLIAASEPIEPEGLLLRGVPPLGTCTICVGKKEIGWQHHFGVVRRLEGPIAEHLFRGE